MATKNQSNGIYKSSCSNILCNNVNSTLVGLDKKVEKQKVNNMIFLGLIPLGLALLLVLALVGLQKHDNNRIT